ncbi:MAG: MGMT family protein [Bacteroidales bacterium]|nr:MGMT family protein [Bacteroidales bacterium]
METDPKDKKWIVVRIDGKIAAVSTDYRMLASITERLARKNACHDEITAVAVGFNEVWKLRNEVGWDDLMLFGTDFQKSVWRKLWELTHTAEPTGNDGHAGPGPEARLISYSDFADLCRNRAGVRAVAHAIGLNPVSVIIPCHLVIPKESVDKMSAIRRKAESTIFKGEDLCLGSILKDESIDFGEYSLGRSLKRELINLELIGHVS